ncbi:glycosyltransferase family 4 protein [Sphingomonas sp. ABOLD]|uniref:Glycosyltransferase involved in cell wall biosynthesis n=1 Tax=Sphingomonas trueperi TaxID=53317 RepID=A0A7X6BF52_9SPHN|nr:MULTISPECIES: glycosyltransferase [Sphingomonas]NJC00021.1 glycosyltransferase involved in cell wall biosynthesis [Sphingomonas trueperi]RSV37289.1 glycosyltransferase family 4 protein [Sphingomonas sp. ABOLD]
MAETTDLLARIGSDAATRPPRVAIVHYWLVGIAGGEQVVRSLLNIYPQADVFTLIADPDVARKLCGDRKVGTSYLQKIPGATKMHRKLLPLMPGALENLDLSGYDLVISSESGPAKGVLVPLGAKHICYCHTPMRYLWDQFPEYRRESGALVRWMMSALIGRLRMWDFQSAARVDAFVANSHHVARRIAQYYRREAAVIAPPVDVDKFHLADAVEDYYLITGRHVGYKRIDLAIDACERLGRRLVITGTGPDTDSLKRRSGRNTLFVGQCSFAELKDYYAKARAFLMPGEEDFGIAPVEAMASGRPVLAFARGGALDTVIDGTSGILFDEQSADGLCDAILRFEAGSARFEPKAIRAHASGFSRARFEADFKAFVDRQC